MSGKGKQDMKLMNDWIPETKDLLTALIAAGFTLTSVDNGESRTKFDGDLDKFIVEATATDESHVYMRAPDGKKVWIYLVLGNSPGEIASDYVVHDDLDKVTEAHYDKWIKLPQPTKEA